MQNVAIALQDWVQSLGVLGWVASFLLMLIASITPLPDSWVAFGIGISYATIWAVMIVFLAGILGASGNFFLARLLGKHYIHARFPHAADTIDTLANKAGFQMLILARLVPNPIPIDIVSYSAGVSTIAYPRFLLASAIGMLPGQVAIIFLAHGFSSLNWLLLAVGLVAIVFLTFFARHVLNKH